MGDRGKMVKRTRIIQVGFSVVLTLVAMELIMAIKEGDTSKAFSCVLIFLLVAVLYGFILKRTK